MGYGTLLKYGLPALLILGLGIAVYTLKAEVRALKAEAVLLREANATTAESALQLRDARDNAVETGDKRLAAKDRTIAQLRKICKSTITPPNPLLPQEGG